LRSPGQLGVPCHLLTQCGARALARLAARLVARRVAFRGRLLGPVLDVVGDTPAQVVPDGVRGDTRIGPGTAVLVLVGAGLELAPDQDRLTLVHAGAHVMGQPVPAADAEVRGLRVAPLPGSLVEVPGRYADAKLGNRLSGPGGANVRLLGHVADEGHKGALAHVDPPWVPRRPDAAGPLHRAGAR